MKIMLSASCGTFIWVLLATYGSMPISTTHSLIGALIGAGIAEDGLEAIHWATFLKIVIGWIVSPILGFVASFGLYYSIQKLIFEVENTTNMKENVKYAGYYTFTTMILSLFILLNGPDISLEI